ncbi:MAG: hypothetical protein CL920_20670 [Deltaproteobacteria bacterium]|nr:hypothetical protein [Deltaproteobacteria bacterium]MBU51108.1 hypothetical protein [Deltaproteobacteria bacterium]|tara:strand:- start:820 stop:1392 length:573 start_codon:yes stop_codon:yes gene_type:complete
MTTSADEPDLKKLFIQTIVGLIVIVAFIALLSVLYQQQLHQIAAWMYHKLGYTGIFLGVLISDTLGFPVPPDAYLLVAIAKPQLVTPTLIVICTGSLLAGVINYPLGPFIKRLPILNERLEYFRPQGEALYKKWGVIAVVFAALTPLPFSVFCWLAGIYRMPILPYLLSILARVPRFILYYYLFRLGWVH